MEDDMSYLYVRRCVCTSWGRLLGLAAGPRMRVASSGISLGPTAPGWRLKFSAFWRGAGSLSMSGAVLAF
jgi:hypothetical protein